MGSVPKELLGCKSHPYKIYATPNFDKVFQRNWDFKRFPKLARLKRDPENPLKKIPFRSANDFWITIMRKELGKGRFDFDFDMERNNPDHPDFKEVHS